MFYKFSAIFAIIIGLILAIGGLWGIGFTYKSVSQEQIVTPDDASIPNAKVRDPITLKTQANIIRKHALKSTDGKTYAQMPRQVPSLDENRNPILDTEGNEVMIPNQARNIWITATSLTTALNLAIISYAFSTFTILMGLVSIWTGFVYLKLSKSK